jgi:hypothetical protein
MALLIQRIGWNSLGWREPTGEQFRKEQSYVGKNGFGHEDWNFAAADIIGGKFYGYSYYQPGERSPFQTGKHDVYFYGINPAKAACVSRLLPQCPVLGFQGKKEVKEKLSPRMGA